MSSPNKKRLKSGHQPMDLQALVKESGGQTGYRLDSFDDANGSTRGGASIASRTYRSGASMSRGSRSLASNTTGRTNRQQRPAAVAHIVCAISENLAKETCVASLDASAPVTLQVTKQGNGQTYAETLAYLELLCPDEVLLNEGRRNSQLARKILELFDGDHGEMLLPSGNESTRGRTNDGSLPADDGPGRSMVVVKFISRACFDQTKGAALLERVAREDTYDASVVSEYILLSAAQAVLHYTQQNLGATFAKKCLHLMVNSGGTNKMVIDRSTLMQLELLANAKSGKTKASLISTIDHTKTSVGNRLLRTNLMSPPTRIDTITSRLDLVDAFLADEDFFYQVMEHLQQLPCLDKMLTNVALVPPKRTKSNTADPGGGAEVTKKMARKGISALIGIKTTLAALPAFTRALEDRLAELERQQGRQYQGQYQGEDDVSTLKSNLLLGLGGGPASDAPELQHNHLLRAIIVAMKNEALVKVFEVISSSFTKSTTSAQRNAQAMRHEECFAVKAENTSLMGVVRKQFLANVDDINTKADDLSGLHGFHVSVRYSASRGYYLSVPEGTELPPDFIHPAKSGRFITFTTEEVQSLNIRAQDNVQDLLFMTDAKIQEVLDVARSHYDALASLSDAIALLDMCHGFADCVTQKSNRPWSRPILTSESDEVAGENGLVIRNGRYVVEVPNSLTSNDGDNDFVANDTYTTKQKNFTIISGINGSGKSTYLKQIAIIAILSHCGSYVPAEFASIPIRDRLCTRIGNTDDQEHNISTFMLEMKETAFICRNSTPKSLILIDELGRATSNEDGVALAWAVSEKLLKSNALTFFVTHYPQVTQLSNVYPSVQNFHMEATVGHGEGGEIFYTHKVGAGPCTVATSYGVDLAYACGWPGDVLGQARTFESHLREESNESQLIPEDSDRGSASSWGQTAKSIVDQLTHLLAEGGPKDTSSARTDLENIRQSFKTNAEDGQKVSSQAIEDNGTGRAAETQGPHYAQAQTQEAQEDDDCSCSTDSSDDSDSSSDGSTSSSGSSSASSCSGESNCIRGDDLPKKRNDTSQVVLE